MSAAGAYLILGGTTKAATTSLFAWLSAHPQVSPARVKEPRYFLDADYPLGPIVPHARGLAAYEALFEDRDRARIRLEATPDYLHSPGSAARIRAELPRVRLVFSLRDPVSRLVSWFRFARAGGRLPPGEGLEAWIRRQEREPGGAQHDRALEQGRYAPALRRYFEVFPREDLLVLFHEDLGLRPREVVRELCTFAGLDPGFYEGFGFPVHNRSAGHRQPGLHRAYQRLALRAQRFAAERPALFALLSALHRRVMPAYRRVNERTEEETGPAPELERWLTRYYADDVRALEALLGRPVPWPRFTERGKELPRAG